MVAGKAGLRLEAFKFGIYVGVPIAASLFFSDPETVKYFVDYFKYIEYPPTENTSDRVKKDIDERIKSRKIYEKQHKEYQEQLKKLNERAKVKNIEDEVYEPHQSWWRLSGWFRRNPSGKETPSK